MSIRRGPHVLDLDQSQSPLLGRAPPPPPPTDPYIRRPVGSSAVENRLPDPYLRRPSAVEDRLPDPYLRRPSAVEDRPPDPYLRRTSAVEDRPTDPYLRRPSAVEDRLTDPYLRRPSAVEDRPTDPYLRRSSASSAVDLRRPAAGSAVDREIQAMLADNQRLAAVHVALRQEMMKAQHELRVSAETASRVRADKEAELRDVLERAGHAEAAARQVDDVRMEIARVSEDVMNLKMVRDEMVERLVGMKADLGRMKAENGRVDAVAKEIEGMQRELQKGRAAIEFEKKAHVENQEQSKQMESNMVSMAREIEKLRAELVNIEKKIAGNTTSNPGYVGAYLNPVEVTYADAYNQVQNAAGTATQPPTVYNTQHIHPQR